MKVSVADLVPSWIDCAGRFRMARGRSLLVVIGVSVALILALERVFCDTILFCSTLGVIGVVSFLRDETDVSFVVLDVAAAGLLDEVGSLKVTRCSLGVLEGELLMALVNCCGGLLGGWPPLPPRTISISWCVGAQPSTGADAMGRGSKYRRGKSFER